MERRVVLVACFTVACAFYTVYRIYQLENTVATQDDVNAVVDQLNKASSEIQGRIKDLEDQVAAGETPDLTALKQAAQALDDVVPDSVPDEPAPPAE